MPFSKLIIGKSQVFSARSYVYLHSYTQIRERGAQCAPPGPNRVNDGQFCWQERQLQNVIFESLFWFRASCGVYQITLTTAQVPNCAELCFLFWGVGLTTANVEVYDQLHLGNFDWACQCCFLPLREGLNWKKNVFFRALPKLWGGGVYPCPKFLALFLEVHFWSIKRVYFFKNANVLNF